MNDLFDIIRSRRSVRKYTGESVSQDKLDMVLQAGLLSPSGCNYKPWEFIVVKNRDMLCKLSKARTGSADMLTQADCAIVVLGDTDKTTVWCEDCSVAMTQMQLMADHIGLGACWIQIRLRSAQNGQSSDLYLRELLGYPENFSAEAILSLGIPAEKRPPYDIPLIPDKKIHYDKF